MRSPALKDINGSSKLPKALWRSFRGGHARLQTNERKFFNSRLELESQSKDGTTLIHVVDKVILVVVNIQDAVATNQRNFRV